MKTAAYSMVVTTSFLPQSLWHVVAKHGRHEPTTRYLFYTAMKISNDPNLLRESILSDPSPTRHFQLTFWFSRRHQHNFHHESSQESKDGLEGLQEQEKGRQARKGIQITKNHELSLRRRLEQLIDRGSS